MRPVSEWDGASRFPKPEHPNDEDLSLGAPFGLSVRQPLGSCSGRLQDVMADTPLEMDSHYSNLDACRI